MTKVLIVDDHAIFREGLKAVIARNAGITAVDEAADGIEALAMLENGGYDLVILDLSLPGLSGLDVLARIKAMKPAMRVLILSMYPEEQFALRALKAGAAGYVTKGGNPRELLDALQRVMGGMRYVSPGLAEMLAEGVLTGHDRAPHEALSPREFQVLRLIVAGVKPSQIAEDLGMSVKTVGTYRSRILEKMRMKTNAELTRYAVENELV